MGGSSQIAGTLSGEALVLSAERERFDGVLLAVAVCGSLLAHGVLLLFLLLARIFDLVPPPTLAAAGERAEPVSIVPARLVRLGNQPEPGKLPDRIVPALPTAPNDGIPVSTELEPPPPEKAPQKRRPLNPVEDDKVRDVLARIRAFGEVTDHSTSVGDPSGVPGGDVSDPAMAQQGSLWARQIHEVLKAYITYPTIIPEEELKRLRCKVEVQVDPDLVPREAKIAERGWSGNRFYDQAILDSFETMRLKRVKLPPPPREFEDQLFRAGLLLNIYGRELD